MTVAIRRRRMAEETRHTLAGAAVFAGLVILFILSAASNGGPLGSYSITARFATVEGVFIDSPVRLAGVRIGRVSAMDYDWRTQRAVLTLEIDPGVELPNDSLAIVTSEGMLGGRFIKIDPGGSTDMLADGDEIEFTQGSVLFEELLAKIITAVEQKRLARHAAETGGAPAEAAPPQGGTGAGQ